MRPWVGIDDDDEEQDDENGMDKDLPKSRFLREGSADDEDALFNELVDFKGGDGSNNNKALFDKANSFNDDDLSAKLGAIQLGSNNVAAVGTRTPRSLGAALRQTTPFSTKRRDGVAGVEKVVMDLLMEQHDPPTSLSEDDDGDEGLTITNDGTASNLQPSSVIQSASSHRKNPIKKKMLGVRFDVEKQPLHNTAEKDDTGSVVIVMTPVRAKKKEREVLGVDSVVTPVRRSRRLYNDNDYVATREELEEAKEQSGSLSSSSTSSSTSPCTTDQGNKDQLSKLLAEHGFAYVPNKAFPLPQTKTPLTGNGGGGGGARSTKAGHTPFARHTRAATPASKQMLSEEEED